MIDLDIRLVGPALVGVLIVALGAATILRSRSPKAMFGAAVERTVGEVTDSRNTYLSAKVHVLDGAPEKAVGLELHVKAFNSSMQRFPLSLSANETKKLIALLQAAHDRTPKP